MDRENEKFVDQLFAASLDGYASGEPRSGLEGRILAGVAARNRAALRRNWAFGLAFSGLAVLAVAVALRMPRHTTVPASQPLRAAAARPAVATVRPKTAEQHAPVAARNLPTARVRSAKAHERRPEQFPTPAPLSEQEKLLLLYVKQTPKSVLAAPPEDTEKDLEIPDLKIAALQIKELATPHVGE